MSERLVVIGGDAGGMAAASEARRRRADLEIVVVERGRWTSYSACGIPYVVGGDVDDLDDLVVRTPAQFRERGIEARVRHEAMAIDLDARQVEVRDHEAGVTYRLGFDLLHVATGATPLRPPLPGIDDGHVHGVQTLEDAAHLLDHVRRHGDSCTCGDSSGSGGTGPERVVVVGAGYIGLEMAEAFVKRGCRVTVVDSGPQPMSSLDPDIGAVVAAAMRKHGIEVRCEETVSGFEPGVVHTEAGRLEADLVVLGLGVVPNSRLAAEAGVGTGVRGAISVDPGQRTSAAGVWAAGDCCESFHLVSRRPVHAPLGTVANKQGRVAGVTLAGGAAAFPGVVGTAVTKLCSLEVARTGLNEAEASAAGLRAHAVTVESTTRAGYFPGAARITVKLVVEDGTGRLLGGQIVGQEGAAKRIDVVATAVTVGLDVRQVAMLDLSYAPPFAPVLDPVLLAARKAAEALR